MGQFLQTFIFCHSHTICQLSPSKNLRIQLDDPNLQPRSLDAFLELKTTVEIMTGQIHDPKKQLEDTKQKLKEKEEDNKILKKQVEQELADKSKTLKGSLHK